MPEFIALKIERVDSPFTEETINISQFLKEILKSFEVLAKESDVKFHYEVDPDLEICSDRRRLNVVLSNLVYNAIKYHDSNKQKRIINVHAIRQSDCLVIQVIDNGIGISKEYCSGNFIKIKRYNYLHFKGK